MAQLLKRLGVFILIITIALLSINKSSPENLSNAAPQVEEIPFQLIMGTYIMVNMSINESEPIPFMLDTGCNGMIIGKKLAKKLKLEKVSTSLSLGVKITKQYSLNSFSVDGIPSSPGKELYGGEFPPQAQITTNGIISANFLHNSKLTIDYQERLLTIAQDSQPEHKINFDLVHDEIMLKVRINDSEPLPNFALDTGASASLINEKLASELGLQGVPSFAGSLDKPTLTHSVRVKSLSIGNNTVKDLTCGVMEMGRIPIPGIAGLIGGSFLSKFKVTIDYPRQRLILIPYEDLKTKEKEFTIDNDTFTAQEAKMSFSRPNKTWEFSTDTPLSETLVILKKKDSPAKITFASRFASGVKVEDCVTNSEFQNKGTVRRYHKLSGDFTTIANQRCYIQEYTAAPRAQEIRGKQLLFKLGDTLCSFAFVAPKDDFESLVEEFEKVISSIKFSER